jgi:hypothetical protein
MNSRYRSHAWEVAASVLSVTSSWRVSRAQNQVLIPAVGETKNVEKPSDARMLIVDLLRQIVHTQPYLFDIIIPGHYDRRPYTFEPILGSHNLRFA